MERSTIQGESPVGSSVVLQSPNSLVGRALHLLRLVGRDLVYVALIIALSPWLVWRSWQTGRYRTGLREKFFGCRAIARSKSVSRRFWLHGVSVGEIQLFAPLIEQLRKSVGQVDFVISTTTETGMDLAKRLFGQQSDIELIYFPLDLSWAVRRSIRNIRADLLVLGELEVWPNLLELAEQLDLPVAVINGRLSPRSFRGYQRLSWLTRPTFSKLSLVVAQTDEYACRFVECGVPSSRVVVEGSFKFDNVSFDPHCPEVHALRELVGLAAEHVCWILGSSQDPEESVCCQAFIAAKQRYPGLKLVIVPRHRERFEEVYQLLLEQPIRVIRRSGLHESVSADQWDVLLVDTIGELRWWWGLAQLALVGGSFGSRNGQNMLEPAAYGACVAFGPKTLNFRAIVELLLQAEAASQIDSLAAIPGWLEKNLNDPALGRAQGQRAVQLIRSHQGAVSRTVARLIELLPQTEARRIAA